MGFRWEVQLVSNDVNRTRMGILDHDGMAIGISCGIFFGWDIMRTQ